MRADDADDPLGVVRAYHEQTKHRPGRFARSLGYMDWATQPDPFRRFEGAPEIALPIGQAEGGPLLDDLSAGALPSAAPVGTPPDHHLLLATEAASLVLFLPLTYAFGFHSKILFAFLLDIDLLYLFKLARGYGHVGGLETPIALATLGLGGISLYIALAMLVNPTAGRAVFPIPGPLFGAKPVPSTESATVSAATRAVA